MGPDRSIRVFISSTFRDMEAERNELVKIVFPQLRKLCEERDVSWSEIDLRWGITDEEKSEDKVLPICLQEIQKCRPYLIGILGDRYGWVPDSIPEELVEKFSFLQNHPYASVTELEIWHGVLENPESCENAYFYFRSPEFVHTVPEEQRANYLEQPSNAEIQQGGLEQALKNVWEREQKLIRLKDRIRTGGFPLREGFLTPKELGEFILEDFTNLINRLYPAEVIPDVLAQERAEHQKYAVSRTGAFIKREQTFNLLDLHTTGNEPPLVFFGEAGSGKSTLLAKWAVDHAARHPEDNLIIHFAGSSSRSSDLNLMLRRLTGELRSHLKIQADIEDDPTTLPLVFRNLLRALDGKGKIILLIDSLDQLENQNKATDLLWLPNEVPTNLRIILSTTPGKTLEMLRARGWPVCQVEPFSVEEKKQYISEYLSQYGKKLSNDLVNRIAGAAQTALPLYLRSLLEELRLYGDHFTLEKKISEYLQAPTTERLFELIIQRFEQDFQRDRPNLVRDTLSYLWGARQGLSDAELLDLLSTDELPLPRAVLSPLYLAIEPFLNIHDGLMNLFHDQFRTAVQQHYLDDNGAQKEIHLRLAHYFLERGLSSRSITEGPWQLMKAEAWTELSNQLADLSFLEKAWKDNPADVLTFWHAIESNSKLKAADAYKFILDAYQAHADSLSLVSDLLIDLDHLTLSLAITKKEVLYYQKTGQKKVTLKALVRNADLLREGGDLEDAMKMYQGCCVGAFTLLVPRGGPEGNKMPADKLRREAIDKGLHQLGQSLANPSEILTVFDIYLRALYGRALIAFNQANTTTATDLLTEGIVFISDALVRYSKQSPEIKHFFGRHFLVFLSQHTTFSYFTGGEKKIEAMMDQCEELGRIYGDMPILATMLNNKGMLLEKKGNYQDALKALEESGIIFDRLGQTNLLRANLRNQSLILAKLGNPTRTLTMLEMSEKLAGKTQRERFHISADRNLKSIYLGIISRLFPLVIQIICVAGILFGILQPIFIWLDKVPGKFFLAGVLLLAGVAREANSKWRARIEAAKELKADGAAPASIAEIQARKNWIFNHQVKQMMIAWVFYAEMLALSIWGIVQFIGIIPNVNFFNSIPGNIALIATLNLPMLVAAILFSYQKKKVGK